MMHGIPTLKLLNEEGQWETCYCFPDPSHPWRECCITYSQEVEQTTHVLEPEAHLWSAQGDA
eukprot:6464609-Amphidinium_carterae.1